MPPLAAQDVIGDVSAHPLLTLAIGTSTLAGGSDPAAVTGDDGVAPDLAAQGALWADSTGRAVWTNFGTAEEPDWATSILDIEDGVTSLAGVSQLHVAGATVSGTPDAATLTIDDQISRIAASGTLQVAPSAEVTGDGHAEASNNADVGGNGDANTSSESSVGGDGNAYANRSASVAGDGNAEGITQVEVTGVAVGRAIAALRATAASNHLGIDVIADASGVHLFTSGIPTADPHVAGEVWADSGVLTISAG